MSSTVFRFLKRFEGMADSWAFWDSLYHEGRALLNRTEWRGKEPRSCGVTKASVRPHYEGDPAFMDIEITYRPKGYISFEGQTRFDGWTATLVDKMQDGTLLDGKGQPLPEGEPVVYLPFELNHDIDYNVIDFGEFVGEADGNKVKHLTSDDVIREMQLGAFCIGGSPVFMAARRIRPLKKIILSAQPSGLAQDGFGTQLVNIYNKTPNLQTVLMEKIEELVCEFLEGQINIDTMNNKDSVFVRLSKTLVDCGPNEDGLDSFFDILHLHTPANFLDELARRLAAIYEVDVAVVDGEDCGLLLKRPETA